VAVCSAHSALAAYSELDWAEVPRWPLVVNTVSGTTGPWSWPPGQGSDRVIETEKAVAATEPGAGEPRPSADRGSPANGS
jgi:hypothetical protein